jgi:iron-sulfur cluster assembly protein
MIQLTESAAKKVKAQLSRRGRGVGLRVGVKTTGCSGLAYVLEYVDCPEESDYCFEGHDCKLFVDPKSLPYVSGLEIDWVRNGLNEGFEFMNPNSKGECGCGESFRV